MVLRALERLVTGRTTLLISHKLATVSRSDYIYVLTCGQIAEEGTSEVLIGSEGLYARLFSDKAQPSFYL
jgi:ATP-binding cassette subfamily B protein